MNIFALHTEPRIAAQYHCDKHVVKMILESAQMLSTCHREAGTHKENIDDIGMLMSFNPKHPCNLWVLKSLSNYEWLSLLAKELCKEYTFRYGRTHSLESTIDILMWFKPNIKDEGLTPFALAMPDDYKVYKVIPDSHPSWVLSYRKYYLGAKKNILHYTKRSKPDFITQNNIYA